MYLEIISPEKVLFKGEVESVSVPGANGDFQMLNNHAAILSTLIEGTVKFETLDSKNEVSDEISVNGSTHTLKIKGGVIEMSDNKATVLPS